MKRFVTNIGVYFLALTVFCLSIGFNITKLTCNEITTITLGDNSLSCSTEKITNCEDQTFAESCCIVENLVECCSTSSSCLCGKELSSLKYDFLTFLSEKNDVEKTIFFDLLAFRTYTDDYCKHLNKFADHPPPPKSRQQRLAEIQSFLI